MFLFPMERLDHPKLEVLGITCPGPRPGIELGSPRWEASTLEKSHSNSPYI
jgi:hypothetical protein